MATRVAEDQVTSLLQNSSADVTQALEIANDMVTAMLVGKSLTDTILARIELFLAAHLYTLTTTDGPLAAQTIGEATERYHDIYGPGLKATKYGQQAITMDTSLTLAKAAANVADPVKQDARFQVI